jgi:hypothetical protein
MKQIILTVSPVHLNQTMSVFDTDHPDFSNYVKVFQMKDLEKIVFAVHDIGTIKIAGGKAYTKRIEQKLKEYELTTYGKNNIKYELIERR